MEAEQADGQGDCVKVAVYLPQNSWAPGLHHFRFLVAEGPGVLGALQFGNQWLSKAAASTWEPTGFKGSRIRDDSQRGFPRALPQSLLLSALCNGLEASAVEPH